MLGSCLFPWPRWRVFVHEQRESGDAAAPAPASSDFSSLTLGALLQRSTGLDEASIQDRNLPTPAVEESGEGLATVIDAEHISYIAWRKESEQSLGYFRDEHSDLEAADFFSEQDAIDSADPQRARKRAAHSTLLFDPEDLEAGPRVASLRLGLEEDTLFRGN
jgi:hypothetical protein